MKQYLATAAVLGHALDVTDVRVTEKYTITVSSDGYAAFWDRRDLESVQKKEICTLGVHSVAIHEEIPANSLQRVTIAAFGCFDLAIRVYAYTEHNLETWREIAKIEKSWAPAFAKDDTVYFLATCFNGSTALYSVDLLAQELAIIGQLSGKSFPNAVCGSLRRAAVGYHSGDVVVFDLKLQTPLFTFHSTDLQATLATSVPRALAISPGNLLLAVARDNLSAGAVTLYDLQHGELVGALTTPLHLNKVSVGAFAHDGWVMGLDFNGDGTLLASAGYDKCVRVWGVAKMEREATILVLPSDLDDAAEGDVSVCSGVRWVGQSGGGEGLVVSSFDRGVRWYREAGRGEGPM